MSKKIEQNMTDLEAGVRTIEIGRGRYMTMPTQALNTEKFSLVVVQPVKGKPGKEIFSADIHAESVTEAVHLLRQQVEGSGWIVLQKADFKSRPIINPIIAEKLSVAYQARYGAA